MKRKAFGISVFSVKKNDLVIYGLSTKTCNPSEHYGNNQQKAMPIELLGLW